MGEWIRVMTIGSLLAGGLMLVAAGCAGQTAPSLVAPPPTSVGASSPSPSRPPATPEDTPRAEPTIAGPHYSLVGLGDSVPGGLKCNAPCQSYVLTYGDLAAAALGLPVAVANLATN